MKSIGVCSFLLACLAGCSSATVVEMPSRNQNSRVNYLVIHFTTENFGDSLALLTEPSDNSVSSHYLIPEPFDDSYTARRLKVHKLVDESRRAWHAGTSYWAGEEALNDRSIGIELVNRSYCVDDSETGAPADSMDARCFFPDFAPRQIDLLVELASGILSRHAGIDPVDVVGHADIAPDRKVDPGPRFPWQALYRAGIGAWYDDTAVLAYERRFAETMPPIETIQKALREYGYRIDVSGNHDQQSQLVVRAFQMHFHPESVSSDIDLATAAILFALIEKYRFEALDRLLEFAPPGSDGETVSPDLPTRH